MFRKTMGFGLLLVVAVNASAQSPKQVTMLPIVEVVGKVGDLIRLDAKFTGEVDWIIDSRLRTPERHERVPGIKRLLVVANQSGTYTFAAISAEGTKPVYQEFVVTVTGGPTPPIPPDPPVPTPNTLDAKIKAAYQADLAAGKGTNKDRDILAASFATLATFMDNELLTTVKHTKDLTNATLSMAMTKGALPSVAAVVSAHIKSRVPEADATALTPEIRARVKATFNELRVALEKAK